jgi:transcriptional regulator with XRE-family HTH domain
VVSDPIPLGYYGCMEAAATIRTARARSGLSLRALAHRCGTSHSALAAYESGRVVPTVATLARVVRGAGFDLAPELTAGVDPDEARGRELVDVLELAAMFPARHAATLEYPRFGPAAAPPTAAAAAAPTGAPSARPR